MDADGTPDPLALRAPADPPAHPPAPRAPLDLEALQHTVRAAVEAVSPRGLGRVEGVASAASTSSDLVAAAGAVPGEHAQVPSAWPDRSVLVADHQVAGRGRAGRTWETPAGVALTFSVLLRPAVPSARLGWVPLLGGLAVVQALAGVVGLRAVLKWPNDVLVDAVDEVPGWGAFRKVAGVLGDLVATPDGTAVVLGIGINVAQRGDELPVPSASSLALAGAVVDRTVLLATVLARWAELDDRWRAHDGDAGAAGLAAQVAAVCTTIGRDVEVDLPGGAVLAGLATGLADDGALLVTTGGRTRAVHAGDVRLRTRG